MKPERSSTEYATRSDNRRSFLKSAGVVALVAPTLPLSAGRPMPPQSEWWHGHNRLRLLAEGPIPDGFVLPPLDPPPPLPPGLEVRLRATFPVRNTKDVLAIQIFLSPPGPTPTPVPPPPLLPGMNPTLSYAEVKVTAVEWKEAPGPNLALLGYVIANHPAMLGDMTGAGFVLTTGYIPHADGTTGFPMLGAHVPGHHTTIAAQGWGTLLIR